MIIVTGGTSGLGKAIVKGINIKGIETITISRNIQKTKNHFKCDITEYEECDGSTFAWFITSVGADNTPNTGDENTSAIEGTDYEFVNQTISTN